MRIRDSFHHPTLCLHADDFGMNPAVNAGILRSLETGLLTSTSVLANAPAADAALSAWSRLDLIRRSPGFPGRSLRHRVSDRCASFDLGVHFNLTQGRPLTAEFPEELLDRDGCFPGIFSLFAKLGRLPAQTVAGTPARRTADAIARELRAQVEVVTAHGLVPTHFNGHQYIELIPVVGGIVIALAREYGIDTIRVAREPQIMRYALSRDAGPVQAALGLVKRQYAQRFARAVATARLTSPAAYFGTLHAGKITTELLDAFLEAGRRYRSVEIGLHPAEVVRGTNGVAASPEWSDPLAEVRPRELDWLCAPTTADLIAASGYELGRLFRLPTPASRRDFTLHAA